MKIGIETSALSQHPTGTGRYITCLIEQLKNTEHKLTTFSPVRQANENGFAKRLLTANTRGIQKHLYRQFFLSGEMNKEGVDCGFFPDYFIPAQFRKPAAVIIHDLSFITHPQFYSKPFVIYYTRQLKQTLKKRPVIITVSENSKEQIHKHLGISKDNIHLVQAYSNFHTGAGRLNRHNIKRPYLLYVGHVEPRKNLQFLIENFLRWKEDRKVDICLIITGEIWIKSCSINLLLNRYMNNPDIKFTGYVQENELNELYSNAAGFVHTSFVEGFGLPVLEAMHYGLPIICSQGTATEEISAPNSIIIDPTDNLSLQKGLNVLYSRYLLNEDTNYKIKFSPELMSKQLNAVLDILDRTVNNHISGYWKRANNTEEAVEKTLFYASLFNSGLKKDRLLKSIFDIKTTEEMLRLSLNNLLNKGAILIKDDNIYLNTTRKNFYDRNKRNNRLRKSLLILKILKAFPLISAISFSGGTAHYGLSSHNDIDLFIITKPNSLYPVYAVIHLLSFILGLRDVICANYLIDENNLEIKSPRDFYTAHQIISLVPYKDETKLKKFLSENRWINYFFPNFKIENKVYKPAPKLYTFLAPLNIMVMMFYKNLYREKILKDKTGSLKLTPNSLKLHTNDHRLKTISLFENEWEIYCENKNREHINMPKLHSKTAGRL